MYALAVVPVQTLIVIPSYSPIVWHVHRGERREPTGIDRYRRSVGVTELARRGSAPKRTNESGAQRGTIQGHVSVVILHSSNRLSSASRATLRPALGGHCAGRHVETVTPLARKCSWSAMPGATLAAQSFIVWLTSWSIETDKSWLVSDCTVLGARMAVLTHPRRR